MANKPKNTKIKSVILGARHTLEYGLYRLHYNRFAYNILCFDGNFKK